MLSVKKSFRLSLAALFLMVTISQFGLAIPVNVVHAAGITYYVSSSTGNDSNNGTSTSTPWKTLAKVSSITFQAGDVICLKSGDVWNEKLTLHGSGTSTTPITLTSYNTGARPKIKLNFEDDSWCVTLNDLQGWKIMNLELCNAEQGIVLKYHSNSNNMDYIWIENCYIHNIKTPTFESMVFDDNHENWGNAIFLYVDRGSNPNALAIQGVTIKNCFADYCDGFFTNWSIVSGASKNITINGCTVMHMGLNILSLDRVDSCLFENSIFSNNGGRYHFPWGGAVAMNGNVTNTTYQNCEFNNQTRYPGDYDGCAIDYEWGCNNLQVKNCYFFNNDGAGVILYGNSDAPNPPGPASTNTLIDNNIFVQDSRNYCTNNGSTDFGEIAFINGANTGTVSNNTFYPRFGIDTFTGTANTEITFTNNTSPGAKSIVSTPTVSIPAGTYSGSQTISLSSNTSGASIYYTTDGSIPTTSSTLYTGPITINNSACLNAKAFYTGMENSQTLSTIYNIDSSAVAPQVANPSGDIIKLAVTNDNQSHYYYNKFSTAPNATYTFQKGDYIEYDVKINYKTAGAGGIDCIATDGTKLGDIADWQDQNGISGNPAADISSRAYNTWYHRKLEVPSSMIGKTANRWDVAGASEIQDLMYTSYYDNIKVTDGNGTVRKVIFQVVSDSNINATDTWVSNASGGMDFPSDQIRLTVSNSSPHYYYNEFSTASYTFQSGDYIEYDVKLLDAVDGAGGVDCIMTDSTSLRDNFLWQDQDWVSGHPMSDISKRAYNNWYHRKLAVPSGTTGKTASYWDVAGEYEGRNLTYTALYDNIVVTDGNGTVRKVLFQSKSDSNANTIDVTSHASGVMSFDTYASSASPTGDMLKLEVTNNATSSHYYYNKFSTSAYTFQTGDYLEYDIRLLNNVDGAGGVDCIMTDGTNLRDNAGWQDQNGISGHPNADISSRAYFTWYHRKLAIPSGVAGKVASRWDIAGECETANITYIALYDNIVVTDGNGTERKVLFKSSADSDVNAADSWVSNALATMSVEPFVARAWEYNTDGNAEEWTAVSQISNVAVSGGYYNGMSTGADPYLYSGNNLGVDITSSKVIKVRFKNSTYSTIAQIYFSTNADTTMNDAKSMNFTIIPNDSGYREYAIDMSTVPGWTGILKQLRFDPNVNAIGPFSIDYIEIQN